MKNFLLIACLCLVALTAKALNPYAYGISYDINNGTLTLNYSLNADANSMALNIYYNDAVVKSVAVTDVTKGAHTVTVNLNEVLKDAAMGKYTFGLQVNGTSVTTPKQESTMYGFYCPHGLAIDKNPASPYFGRLIIAESREAVASKSADTYVSGGKGAGIYTFAPDFTTDGVKYTGGNTFADLMNDPGTTANPYYAFSPFRVRISDDGRIFATSLNDHGTLVWELSQDLQTWTPVISGESMNSTWTASNEDGTFYAQPTVGFDVTGSGENLKLLVYSCTKKALSYTQAAFRLDEYPLGTAKTFIGTPTPIPAFDGANNAKYAINKDNAQVIYDGNGGYWFGASRAGAAGQPNLAHVNAEGIQNYYDESASLYGGDGILVHDGMLFKGKARTNSTTGNFEVFTIGEADGKVTLTSKWKVTANGIGRNINDFALDYANNLYACGNSNEKLIAYALPYSGTVETPVVGCEYEINPKYIKLNWDGAEDETWKPFSKDGDNYRLVAQYGTGNCYYNATASDDGAIQWVIPQTSGDPATGDWCLFAFTKTTDNFVISKDANIKVVTPTETVDGEGHVKVEFLFTPSVAGNLVLNRELNGATATITDYVDKASIKVEKAIDGLTWVVSDGFYLEDLVGYKADTEDEKAATKAKLKEQTLWYRYTITPEASSSRKKVSVKDDTTESGYVAVDFTNSGIVTGVNDVTAAKTVTGVHYYNLQGVESAEPFSGVNIVVTTYSDGSHTSQKVMK